MNTENQPTAANAEKEPQPQKPEDSNAPVNKVKEISGPRILCAIIADRQRLGFPGWLRLERELVRLEEKVGEFLFTGSEDSQGRKHNS